MQIIRIEIIAKDNKKITKMIEKIAVVLNIKIGVHKKDTERIIVREIRNL